MPDYMLGHTGPKVDEGISKALSWDENLIGVKRIPTSLSSPQDLNELRTPGSYLLDFFINGPVNHFEFTPILVSVFESDYRLSQQTMIMTNFFVRQVESEDNDIWEAWRTSTGEIAAISTGTGVDLVVEAPTFVLNDMAIIYVKIHTDLLDGARLKINAEDFYPIYTLEGAPIAEGAKEGSILALCFNADQQRWYLVGGGGAGVGSTMVKWMDPATEPEYTGSATYDLTNADGTVRIYPTTIASAIIYEDGKGLDEILEDTPINKSITNPVLSEGQKTRIVKLEDRQGNLVLPTITLDSIYTDNSFSKNLKEEFATNAFTVYEKNATVVNAGNQFTFTFDQHRPLSDFMEIYINGERIPYDEYTLTYTESTTASEIDANGNVVQGASTPIYQYNVKFKNTTLQYNDRFTALSFQTLNQTDIQSSLQLISRWGARMVRYSNDIQETSAIPNEADLFGGRTPDKFVLKENVAFNIYTVTMDSWSVDTDGFITGGGMINFISRDLAPSIGATSGSIIRFKVPSNYTEGGTSGTTIMLNGTMPAFQLVSRDRAVMRIQTADRNKWMLFMLTDSQAVNSSIQNYYQAISLI